MPGDPNGSRGDASLARRLLGEASSFSQQPASWAVVAVVLAAAGGPRGRRAALRAISSSTAAGVLANVVIKPLVHRSRPPGSGKGIGPITSSFPSGHAATEVAFALAAAQEMPGLLMPLLVGSVAGKVSIVRTRAHHPGDVAAGSLIGVLVAAALWKLWPPTAPGPHGEAPVRGPRGFIDRLNHYHFESRWQADLPPDTAFAALEHLESYPAWWPEVKAVTTGTGLKPSVSIRALLPYPLRFSMTQIARDRRAHTLTACMEGDLNGWSKWTVTQEGAGSSLLFEEEVDVAKPSLRILAPFARSLFRANHAVMMHRGERGLRSYLARKAQPGGVDAPAAPPD